MILSPKLKLLLIFYKLSGPLPISFWGSTGFGLVWLELVPGSSTRLLGSPSTKCLRYVNIPILSFIFNLLYSPVSPSLSILFSSASLVLLLHLCISKSLVILVLLTVISFWSSSTDLMDFSGMMDCSPIDCLFFFSHVATGLTGSGAGGLAAVCCGLTGFRSRTFWEFFKFFKPRSSKGGGQSCWSGWN